jgi:hypothetical protein
MAHYVDLSLCTYHSGPFDSANWSVPLRAIGWLQHPHLYMHGTVPNDVLPKLKSLVEQVRSAYSQYLFRGGMTCSLCEDAGLEGPGPIWSQENVFVASKGVVFVAPGGVVHYIEVHSYLPPPEFIGAVLNCPVPGSRKYCEALRSANLGTDPPLETYDAFMFRVSRFGRR